MYTVILLVISNLFMTLAWYGHLKVSGKSMSLLILMSWGIALLEYVFQVPANRLGVSRYHFTVVQLKILQECITLAVFSVMAYFMFGQLIKWNHIVSYALVIAAVYFAFLKTGNAADDKAPAAGYEIRHAERDAEASPQRAAEAQARESADAA